MSVYKPPNSRYYQFDFRFKGRRHTGSTAETTKRGAQEVERAIRRKAATGDLGKPDDLTLAQASGRWFAEVGQHRAKPGEVDRQLEQILSLIGDPPIREITTNTVAQAIEKRRRIPFTKSPAKNAKAYLPSNSTVNRDVIDTLRPVLSRASDVWEIQGLPKINWKKLRLKEPTEIVRTYSAEERERWLAECDDAARFPLHMLLRYGLRFGELFFPPDALEQDAKGAVLVIVKRKRDPMRLTVRQDDARVIAALIGRAKAAELKSIWFEEVGGELIALTYHGLHARLTSAAKRAAVRPGRVIHGTRHHAGTDVMRRTGSIKITQKMLGHSGINSTARYAHATDDDLRAALENMESRTLPEAEPNFMPKPKRRNGFR